MIINNNEIDAIIMNKDCAGVLNYLLTRATYINMPIMLAYNKALPLTLGEFILFDSEDKKLVADINRWAEDVRFYEKMREIVLQQSLIGKSIAWLERKNPTEDYPNGLLMFKVTNLPLMSGIAKVDDVEQEAVIYTNTGKSDMPSLQRITFKGGEMIVEDMANPDNLLVQHASMEKLKELKPIGKKQVFDTGYSFFPFQEFPNKTIPNIFGEASNTSALTSFPDWWFGRKLIFDVEDNLEKRKSERTKNQTRAFGSFDPMTLENVQKGNIALSELLNDFLINANTTSYASGAGAGSNIAIIQGDPKLEVYHKDKEQSIKTFYETAGYNYFESDGTYTNENKAVMNYDLDIQTTKMKQQDLKQRLYRIIDIVLKDLGHEPRDDNRARKYTINFVSTSIIDDLRLLDLVDRRLANGTLEHVKAIQMLDNVDKQTATDYLSEIDKRNDELLEKENEFYEGEGDNGEDNIKLKSEHDKGGE